MKREKFIAKCAKRSSSTPEHVLEYHDIVRCDWSEGLRKGPECPNCGSADEPTAWVLCAERITFYHCPDCDFSSWDRGEWR